MSDFFQGKRVLVTGGAGFVGTHLLARLLAEGAVVSATTFEKEPAVALPSIRYIRADLRDPHQCHFATKDIDYVFMCAANSSGAAVMEKTPLVHLTPNLLMNANMLEASYANDVKKFCFISSNTVYPLTDYPVKEEDCRNEFFHKYHIVAWMKRFTEIMCEMYSSRISAPMSTVVVRPGNLYGPYDKFTLKESKVIAALIRRACERSTPFTVWGDGTDLKDFLYIDDFIDGLILAFTHLEGYDPINIASGLPVTVSHIVSEILDLCGHDVHPEYDSTKPTMIPKRLIDISKMTQLTGWQPQTSLRDGLQKTIQWYLQYYSDKTPEQHNAVSS